MATSSAVGVGRAVTATSFALRAEGSLVRSLRLRRAHVLSLFQKFVKTVTLIIFENSVVVIKNIIFIISSRSSESIVRSKISVNFLVFVLILVLELLGLREDVSVLFET